MSGKLADTIVETMELTGIGRTSLYKEIRAGRLIARKRGSATLILASDLNPFLAGLPLAER